MSQKKFPDTTENGQQSTNDTGKTATKETEQADIKETDIIAAPEAGTTAPPLSLTVAVRPISPTGNLVGFANVKFNDSFVVEGFRILRSGKGLFTAMPSKPDQSASTGYREVAKPVTAAFRSQLNEAVITAYETKVQEIQSLAAAIESEQKPSITKQLSDGAERAAKSNATRPAPAKQKQAETDTR